MRLKWRIIKNLIIGLVLAIIIFLIAIFTLSYFINSWITNETSTEIDRTREVQAEKIVENDLQNALNE